MTLYLYTTITIIIITTYYMLNPVIDFRVRADNSFQTKVAALKEKLNLTNSSLVKLAISRLWEEENRRLTEEEFDQLLKELDQSNQTNLNLEELAEFANQIVQEVRNK